MSFFQLSPDLHITLLLEWIPSYKVYSSLDVAVCSRRDRPHWLGVLTHPAMKVDAAMEKAPKQGYHGWLFSRMLKVSALHLNVSFLPKIPAQYKEGAALTIETLVLMGWSNNLATSFLSDILSNVPRVSRITSKSLTCPLRPADLLDLARVPDTIQIKELDLITPNNTSPTSHYHDDSWTNALFAFIFRHGHSLEVFRMNFVHLLAKVFDADLLEQIGCRCPNLRVVRFPGTKISFTNLTRFSKSHPHLKELECLVNSHQVTCIDILEHFPDLEVLAVSDAQSAALIPLAKYPRLQLIATASLTIDLKHKSIEFGPQNGLFGNANFITGDDYQNLLLDVPCLLNRIACSFDCAGTLLFITNQGLIAIAEKHGEHLKCFANFCYAQYIDNTTFKQFLVLCPQLIELMLPETPNLNGDALLCIAWHCPHLVTLAIAIEGISDHAVSVVLKRCSKLKRLCMQNCVNISAEVFDHIATSSVSKLAITGSDCLTTNDVIDVLKVGKCRTLSVLMFASCPRLRLGFVMTAGSLMRETEQLLTKIGEFHDWERFCKN